MFYKFWKNMIGHLEVDYKTNHLDAVQLTNRNHNFDIIKNGNLNFCMKFKNISYYIDILLKSFLTLSIKLLCHQSKCLSAMDNNF